MRTAGEADYCNSVGIKLIVLEVNKRRQSEGNISTMVYAWKRVKKTGRTQRWLRTRFQTRVGGVAAPMRKMRKQEESGEKRKD